MPMFRLRLMMRAISIPICGGATVPDDLKRQRKLSVQNVSGDPSGHTLTPRFAINLANRPAPMPDSLDRTMLAPFEKGQWIDDRWLRRVGDRPFLSGLFSRQWRAPSHE